MSALPIIITTAGLNALPNAQNTGVSNVVIASMGVSPTQIAATAATNAIPGEVKRIAGVSGQVVADDQIYISAADQTEDTYVVRTIGLYLDTGVLFAVYSQATPLLEKAGPAMAVLEAAIKLSAPQANAIAFTGGGWLNPQASETVQGVLRLAGVDEAVLGADHSKAVTPKGLKTATTALRAAIQAALDQIAIALAGKANTVHQHAAGDTTSGVFSEARIPALPQDRITGLISALAGKAAAAHGHAMSEITGLVSALGLKLAIADFTWANLVGKPNVAVQGQTATFADVYASRPNGTGAVLLGDGSHYLYFDGASYSLPGAQLFSNGGVVWTSATFDPASKAPVLHSHDWAQVTGKPDLAVQNTQPRFSAVQFGTGAGVIYSEPGYDHLVFRTGASGGYNYAVMRPNGDFDVPGVVRIGDQVAWHGGNFDPASKAAAVHSHSTGQINGLDAALASRAKIAPDTPAAGLLGWASEKFSFSADGQSWRDVWHSGNFNPASKAAAVHSHSTGQIVGLDAALASRAKIAPDTPASGLLGWSSEKLSFSGDGVSWRDVWHSGNFNPADKAPAAHSHDWAQVTGKPDLAVQNTQARFSSVLFGTGAGSVYADAGQDNLVFRTGVAGDYRFAVMGANGDFEVPGALRIGNQVAWHAGNFDPASKAAALHSHDWAQVTGKPAWVDPAAESVTTGYKIFVSTGPTIANGTDGKGALEVRAQDGSKAAYMTFHRPDVKAAFFGLDADGQWKVGGWGMGNVAHRLHHADNLFFAGDGVVTDPAVGSNTHDQMLSPAALWAFARNLGNPAYAVIPGTGLMVQCGVVTGNFAEGQAHATLPVAFGGGCIAAVAVPQNPGSSLASNYFMQVVSKNLDRIVFYANRSDSSSGNISGFEWIAVGRVSGTPDPAYSSGGGGGGGGFDPGPEINP